MSEPFNWENITNPTVPSIPNDAPAVSVDIELGKKYSDVSFDYDAFAAKAEAMGMASSDTGDLSISLSSIGLLNLTRASHNSLTNHINVGVSLPSKVNKKLAHELQHAADCVSPDRRGYGSNLRYALHKPFVTPIMALAGVEYYRALSKLEGPVEFLTDLSTPRKALLGMMGVYLWSYQFHPRERRARKAGRANSLEIVSLKK